MTPDSVAFAVAADPPGVGAWPASGAIPRRGWNPVIVRAGWPHRRIRVMIPQTTTGGTPAPAVAQEVVVVPKTWLADLAERLGLTFSECCRGVVDCRG